MPHSYALAFTTLFDGAEQAMERTLTSLACRPSYLRREPRQINSLKHSTGAVFRSKMAETASWARTYKILRARPFFIPAPTIGIMQKKRACPLD